MKRKYSIFLVILAILYSVALLEIGNNKNEEETLITTFNYSQFQPIQVNINTWGTLNNSFSSLEEMKVQSKKITDALKIYTIDTVEEKDSDTLNELTIIRISKHAKTTVKLQSIRYPETDMANTYVIIDIILYNKYESLTYLKKKLDRIYDENIIKPNTNITITGSVDGELSKKEKEKISQEIMNNIGAKVEDSYETEKIYSIYGYTKIIDDFIVSNNKKINVNCAFRYNEYEEKTYLYLATPLISVEY